MTSQDVIHDFFVPAFRVKRDVLPGQYETLWFHADRPGTYHLFCAQFCGTDHAAMIGDVYGDGRARVSALAGSERQQRHSRGRGQALFIRYGCSGCHRNGRRRRCRRATAGRPVWQPGAAVGRQHGRSPTTDTSAIRSCIPRKQVVASYRAGDAVVRRRDQRGGPGEAHRLHQVAGAAEKQS